MSDWYYGVILPNCDCEVTENYDLIVFIDNCEIAREYGCGFDTAIVYGILEEYGYL